MSKLKKKKRPVNLDSHYRQERLVIEKERDIGGGREREKD